MTTVRILYKDSHFVAIDKPAGLLVHRSNIDRQATEFAIQIVRDQIGQLVYPVHRLDKPTSGVLLFALSSEASSALCEDFRERRIEKHYLALVRGHTKASGVLDRPLTDNPAWKKGRFASKKSEPQDAVTHFETVSQCEAAIAIEPYPSARYSLLKLQPKTGRRHQIRRHLKHAAHPIIGDTTHGDHRHNRFFRGEGYTRMMLVATELAFTHPGTGERVRINAEPGSDFANLLDRIGMPAIERLNDSNS